MAGNAIVKTAILLSCICIVFAHMTKDDEILEGLTDFFNITQAEAQQCIDKTQVRAEDIEVLRTWFRDRQRGVRNTADMAAVDRASCTFTCGAQAQGIMVGSKLNLPKIDELIKMSRMAPQIQTELQEAVHYCNAVIKDNTNECEVGREYVLCTVQRSERH